MPIPDGNVATEHADAGSDSPARAREDILDLMTQFNALIASAGQALGMATLNGAGKLPDAQSGRGQANGVASLTGQGKIPTTQFPASVVDFLTPNVTEDGYTGSGDRYLVDASYAWVITDAGVRLNITHTYAELTP